MAVYGPPCTCCRCLTHQYYSKEVQERDEKHKYVGRLSIADVMVILKARKPRILELLNQLQEIISIHADSIVKRWRRYTPQKRRDRLELACSSGIYPDGDPRILISHCTISLAIGRSHRNALLLPYINLDALSSGSSRLINLLHYRTRFPPESWVAFDDNQLTQG